MKEALFYLEDAFGVKIRVNEQHASRNNNFTLMLVREQLGNTYICSSDDYFTENVFSTTSARYLSVNVMTLRTLFPSRKG